jgi:integrase
MHPIDSVSRAWLDGADQRDELRPATIRSYREHLARFAGHVGPDRDVATISAADVESWLSALKAAGIGPGTRNTRRAVLASFFRWCRARQIIDHDPMLLVGRARTPRGQHKRLTAEQAAAMVQASDPHDGTRLMVLLALQCMLRRGDLEGLQAGHWDRGRQVLTILEGKGWKARDVPVPVEAAVHLDWWLAGRMSGPMWPSSHRPGVGLSARTIGARVSAAGARAGVHCWPHLLRHTGISDAAMAGANPVALARAAGHEDPATTMRTYVHPTGPEVAEALAGRSYIDRAT